MILALDIIDISDETILNDSWSTSISTLGVTLIDGKRHVAVRHKDGREYAFLPSTKMQSLLLDEIQTELVSVGSTVETVKD